MNEIPFNKPYLSGKELQNISEALNSGKISGNGDFTKKCQSFFEKNYGFKKCFLTSSCSAALEMAAILINIQPEDEVIIPTYTFVSTANAFALRGAKIVFADSQKDHPSLDVSKLEALITENTKVIVPVHYAGVACDMEEIMSIVKKHNIFVIEDAAQAIDSYFIDSDGKQTPLGQFGQLSTFSFHETKNIISGEGGLLAINDPELIERAEIIWEKGTNRISFFRNEVDKYGWVDIGSSFLPSELTAAFLYAQLENLSAIQEKRLLLWKQYDKYLTIENDYFQTSTLPKYATQNAHMYYLTMKSPQLRTQLIQHLKEHKIMAVFHYQSLHKSKYTSSIGNDTQTLPESDRYTDNLVRLPLFYELSVEEVNYISQMVLEFFNTQSV